MMPADDTEGTIAVKLDDLLHARRMTLTELADRVGLTLANLSILKTGKAKAIRFSTLEAICRELELSPEDHLLEIGTGSGYQTAVLARFAKEIVSLERIKVLQEKARQRLRALKINNVMLRYADGSVGLQEKAPFDGILAAAAPADVPQELLEQLAIGGRLVIPIGEHEQKLFRITRTEQGYEREFIEDVRFVPFRSGLR